MPTLKHVKTLAAQFGAKVEHTRLGAFVTCAVEAPQGMVWNTGDALHEMVDSAYHPWKPDYADLASRMVTGTIPCPAGPDCEWCNE